MKHIFSCAALFAAALAFSGHAADTRGTLSDTRGTLEKWVETRQLISQTRADWQADKESLEQTAAMLERELKAVEEQFSKVNTNSVQVDKERAEAEASITQSNNGLQPAMDFAMSFEGKVRALLPQLPAPLQETLKPLLGRMPTDAAATKLKAPERIQVLVGVLNEIDKFNNAVSVYTEKRKNAGGAEVSVETVYVGLGAAYFVNEAGDFAGVGTPSGRGWEWTTKPEVAQHVREVIRIYRNERPARFVSLPVTIK